ncbi:JAB domain-containing protein [Burkholderia cepacia]|uniref:JAB domain-containing protein n=1 Tax=Burkholderia cepacia TaxID=292 RepID=UPI001E478FE1|nr:JAB domain-containing protein [Burkholderia cepacia]
MAVGVAHNHPSGHTRPSTIDKQLTQQLKTVLALVDIQLLDHFVIGKGKPFSFVAASLL